MKNISVFSFQTVDIELHNTIHSSRYGILCYIFLPAQLYSFCCENVGRFSVLPQMLTNKCKI
ncbi:hypothetical protein MIDIC_20050 [Alphaproteobacteria bacterium]